MKTISLLFANLIATVIIGAMLLTLVYMLPVGRINKHVHESASVMEEEGAYPILSQRCTSMLDNWTDAAMLLEAAYKNDDPAIKQAMLVNRGAITSSPQETLVEHYLNNKPYEGEEEYARYWHGYLILLKPALMVMNYQTIRSVNLVCELLLTALTAVLLWRRLNRFSGVSWVIAFLMLMPAAMASNMFYSVCFYIFTLAVIAILLAPEAKHRQYTLFVFLNVGIAVAYFDQLSFPIVTFGVPAIIYLALAERESFKEKILNLVVFGAAWLFGYAGMWLAKWLLASWITGQNVFANALEYISLRTSSGLSDQYVDVKSTEAVLDGVSAMELRYVVTQINISKFLDTPVIWLLLVWLVFLFYFAAKKKGITNNFCKDAALQLMVGISPFVWYFATMNHSFIHSRFTNKALVVSALALMLMLCQTIPGKTKTAFESKPDGDTLTTETADGNAS